MSIFRWAPTAPVPGRVFAFVLLLCGDERGRLRVALDVDPDTANHREAGAARVLAT